MRRRDASPNRPDEEGAESAEKGLLEQRFAPRMTRRGIMLFDDIEVILALSEAKSLSQAADRLYMSRPGLT